MIYRVKSAKTFRLGKNPRTNKKQYEALIKDRQTDSKSRLGFSCVHILTNKTSDGTFL